MVAVVAASNVLVQFPVAARLGPLNLAEFLTWGAFSYPFAFLVTDLTNRRFGPAIARRVVVAGFIVGAMVSVYVATPRVATASCTAFLIGQLLDIVVFSRLRRGTWWKGPVAASLCGSAIDTLIFFSLAFSPLFAGLDLWFGRADGSLAFPAPLLAGFQPADCPAAAEPRLIATPNPKTYRPGPAPSRRRLGGSGYGR